MSMQEASVIGVDSLGIDVRAFSGLEARTVRFSFNAQVGSYANFYIGPFDVLHLFLNIYRSLV
jgi:hypothetical protein